MASTAEDWSLYYRVPVAYGEDAAGSTYQIIQVDGSGNVIVKGLVSGTTYANLIVDSDGNAIISGKPLFIWDAVENSFQTVSGTWATTVDASCWLGKLLQNTTAGQNEVVALGGCYIPADADYDVIMNNIKGSNRGKAHILINGVDEGNIDLYATSTQYNQVQTASLGTLTAGLKTVAVKVSDKNASSSGYNCTFTQLSIVKS